MIQDNLSLYKVSTETKRFLILLFLYTIAGFDDVIINILFCYFFIYFYIIIKSVIRWNYLFNLADSESYICSANEYSIIKHFDFLLVDTIYIRGKPLSYIQLKFPIYISINKMQASKWVWSILYEKIKNLTCPTNIPILEFSYIYFEKSSIDMAIFRTSVERECKWHMGQARQIY